MSRKTEAGDGDDGGGGGGASVGLLPAAMADGEEMKRRFGEGEFEFVCVSNEEIGRESKWRFFLSYQNMGWADVVDGLGRLV